MSIKLSFVLLLILLLFSKCNQPIGNKSNKAGSDSSAATANVKVIETNYRSLVNKDSIKNLESEYGVEQLNIILAVNRTDSSHLVKMDTVLMPENLSGNRNQYSPFPQNISYLNIKKIIFFSYPAEYFAAYENGRLIRSGPTNMGRQKDPTPTGLFYTNWKAEDTKSTFNDEWDLKWNFNIVNKAGIGWHQYSLPGYPVSHSCLRLQEDDARYLYNWADEWKLKGKEDIIAKGTPVMVFGNYPFGSSKPWLKLVGNTHALDINDSLIKQLIDSNLNDILTAQRNRDSLNETVTH